MFRSTPHDQPGVVEPLESRCLLSAVLFTSAASAMQAHAAHLAHLAHVRHMRHVRHVARVRLQREAAQIRDLVTMQPPTIPMLSSDMLNNPIAGLTNPVSGLDTVTPVLTTPGASDILGSMSAIDAVTPITGPTPIVSLTTNPFSFSTTPVGFSDSNMFTP